MDQRHRAIADLLALGIDLGSWCVDANGGDGDLPMELQARLAGTCQRPLEVAAEITAAWAGWLQELGIKRPTAGTPAGVAPAPSVPARMRALVAEDSGSQRLTLVKLLENLGFEVTAVADGTEALAKLGAMHFDLILTDLAMPSLDGIGLCRAVRAGESSPSTYVIVLTAHTEQPRLLAAFDAGADDFLSKPINVRELQARVRAAQRIVTLQRQLAEDARALRQANLRLEAANAQLSRTSSTDALTGLPNRRYVLECLQREWEAAGRAQRPLAVIFADIDHFKSINDRFGHDAGDIVIERVARAIRRTVRKMDVVGRFGGEEFVVVCPAAGEAEAQQIAERVRSAVEQERWSFAGTPVPVTVSLGVACAATVPGTESMALLRHADKALYEAKRAGRNQVVICAPTGHSDVAAAS
jgi:diguanylate cyclase (GGDEF)-like protein